MKRKVITLMAFTLFLAGSIAQETNFISRSAIRTAAPLIIDSLYNYWNTYVKLHPKDEVAWRNLYEVSECKVTHVLRVKSSWDSSNNYRKQLNVVGRMEQAIPGTYTFFYSAYDAYYLPPHEEQKLLEEMGNEAPFLYRGVYADSAIIHLPDHVLGDDYDTWAQYLIPKCDTVRLTDILTRYYESGLYPDEILQYHFNELQGMDEGGVYIGANECDIIGKLMLQLVLGVHKDKIIFTEQVYWNSEYIRNVFEQIGIPFKEGVWKQIHSSKQGRQQLLRYIYGHSMRPIYLSAHNMWDMERWPDEMKACFYNEGLTMRYSEKPYDNMSVKRRNIEDRYRLEYLRMSFHPETKRNYRLYLGDASLYAMNYMYLLHDQLLYYKKYNRERYKWLYDIFADIIVQIEKKGCDVEEFKNYLK